MWKEMGTDTKCSSPRHIYLLIRTLEQNPKARKNGWVSGLSPELKRTWSSSVGSRPWPLLQQHLKLVCVKLARMWYTAARPGPQGNQSKTFQLLPILCWSPKRNTHARTHVHRHTLHGHGSSPREQFIQKVPSSSHQTETLFIHVWKLKLKRIKNKTLPESRGPRRLG